VGVPTFDLADVKQAVEKEEIGEVLSHLRVLFALKIDKDRQLSFAILTARMPQRCARGR
jgi:hypothetical protein